MVQKSVLITGCSQGGIGDALAQEFYQRGLRVFATAINLSEVEHLKTLGLEILSLNVVDEASIKKAVESVQALTGGTLDFLVNNAGSGYVMPLLDTETSVAQKMFDVNVFGAIAVTRAFAPLLIASQGTIINNGSLAGKMPVPWQGYYNASKAAINHLTSQLRLELSPFGVNAICIVTGGIKTRFFENLPIKSLPPNSVYAAGEEELKIAFSGSYIYKDGSEADVYARAVVKNALKRSPKVNHWVGHSTFVGWFVDTFLWATFRDLLTVLPSPFKFPQSTKKIRAAQKSR